MATSQMAASERINSTKRTATIQEENRVKTNTSTHRQVAITVGVLFIIATVTAIIGIALYGPILSGPDFLTKGVENRTQVAVGVLMELTLVLSAAGTAIGLFPILRKYSERLALGYLTFRLLEGIFISIGLVSVLSLLTLSEGFVAGAPNATALQASGALLLAVREWTFILGPYLLLGANTVLYSYLLYKSRLVPRAIAALGITGATLVFVGGLLQILGFTPLLSIVPVLLALPVAAYEMILAGWLIIKGFNPAAIRA